MTATGKQGAAPETRHDAFVAGQYRDGEFSDIWTDVARCALGTFVAYAPACTCGWIGSRFPASPEDLAASRRAHGREHRGHPPHGSGLKAQATSARAGVGASSARTACSTSEVRISPE